MSECTHDVEMIEINERITRLEKTHAQLLSEFSAYEEGKKLLRRVLDAYKLGRGRITRALVLEIEELLHRRAGG